MRKTTRFKDIDALESAKARGQIARIRTIRPNPKTYIHVGFKKGGGSVAGRVHHIKGSHEAKAQMSKLRLMRKAKPSKKKAK